MVVVVVVVVVWVAVVVVVVVVVVVMVLVVFLAVLFSWGMGGGTCSGTSMFKKIRPQARSQGCCGIVVEESLV